MAHTAELTIDEEDIRKFVCGDKTTVEIAKIRDKSKEDIEVIVGSLMEKIGVHTTAGIAIYSMNNKLPPFHDSNFY